MRDGPIHRPCYAGVGHSRRDGSRRVLGCRIRPVAELGTRAEARRRGALARRPRPAGAMASEARRCRHCRLRAVADRPDPRFHPGPGLPRRCDHRAARHPARGQAGASAVNGGVPGRGAAAGGPASQQSCSRSIRRHLDHCRRFAAICFLATPRRLTHGVTRPFTMRPATPLRGRLRLLCSSCVLRLLSGYVAATTTEKCWVEVLNSAAAVPGIVLPFTMTASTYRLRSVAALPS